LLTPSSPLAVSIAPPIMRLLQRDSHGELLLTKDVITPPAAYAILSHTWGADDDEVTFDDLEKKTGKNKAGYAELRFCAG